MVYVYRGVKIFYRFFDRKNEQTDIFLHGWGCSQQDFLFCKDLSKRNTLFIDFPPFGRSEKDLFNWNIFTYANMVISLCEHLNIKKMNILGHSFGGRIAIIMAVLCKENVEKIVLIDSAGLKPKRPLSYRIKVFKYKIRKKLNLDVSKYGSSDYLSLNENMKTIFKSVVNTYLDDFLPFINAKTLIIFGKNDTTTPIYMAKKLKRKIKNSNLVLIENAGHFPYLERKVQFLSLIKDFLEE